MPKNHENKLNLDRFTDAAPLMQGDSVYGPSLHINDPWHKIQGEAMVRAAVKDGQLSAEQAGTAHYLYFPQPDGSLFCAAAIRNTPGMILGTMVPNGEWRHQ